MNEKLKKIYELVKRGVGGERVNAERIFNAELLKLNISLDDFLNNTEKSEYRFKFSNKIDERLLAAIIKNVDNFNMFNIYRGKKRLKYIMIECTKSQYVEILMKHNIYKKDFKERQKIFFRAFIHANNLYSVNVPDSNNNELSEKEKDDLRKAAMMSRNIDPSVVNKQLEGNSNAK